MNHDLLVASVDELATRIADGDTVAIGADYCGIAMDLTRAMIRRGVRNLHLVCMPVGGLQADLLIGAGCVSKIETSAVTFGEYGVPYRFHDALRSGSIEILEATCPAIHAALEAGRKDIPFIPLRGIIGSDLLKYRNDWKVVDNPFGDDDRIVLLPAIRPDFALFHAPWADRNGNIFVGRRRELVNMSQASRRGALVTVEEIRDVDLMATEESAAGAMSALYVEALALAPKGAWPVGLWDCYDVDESHFRIYNRMAKTADGFAEYLADYVLPTAPRATAKTPEVVA